MRNLYKFFVALGCLLIVPSFYLFAQVGINADNSIPDPSAMLDVHSTNRGFLPPRMTHAQMNTIPDPVDGLIIYCTNCSNSNTGALTMFVNGAWYTFAPSCVLPLFPLADTHVPTSTQIIWKWNSVADATGYKWSKTNSYAGATDMGALTAKTETGLTCNTAYTRYVWAYNVCGYSPYTTLTESTTMNPVVGVSITSTADTACLNTSVIFTATPTNGGTSPAFQWKKNGAIVSGATNSTYSYIPANNDSIKCQLTSSTACSQNNPATSNSITMTVKLVPPAPAAGNSIASQLQITWNWDTVAHATGYKWSKTNSYAGATDMDTATTYTETGLGCGIAYTRYVWAYNECGSSTPVTLNQTTTSCGGGPCAGTPTVSYGGQTYNTVQIGSQCWFKEDLNIGKRINGIQDQTDNDTIEKYCYNDIESNCDIYGGLYQWTEMMQYLTTPGGMGICPTGWHIPTDEEWCTLSQLLDPAVNCGISGWSGTNAGGRLKSTGTIEAGTGLWHHDNDGATNESGFTAIPAGDRQDIGPFMFLGYRNYYWTSSEQDTSNSWYRQVYYYNPMIYRNTFTKNYGFSVRCLRDF
jgi:uncharacterized protein (TIGR02145 family)